MVQFNFSERTIKAKVVYYGPAQSGKTTNLEQVHVLTDPAGNNRLVSLNTAQDRTLFFDLLPFSLGTVSGYDFQVQLYTVPGQVQYNATRRVVLAGADAVVFVADSRKSMAKDNLAAFENMKVNLLANRLVPEKVPLLLQWNKRDMADLQTEAEMAKALNPWGRTAVPAVAFKGQGVMDTFITIVQQMLQAIAVKYNLKEKGLDPAAVPELVTGAFASLMSQAAAAKPQAVEGGPALEPPSPAKVVLTQMPDASVGPALAAASPDGGLVAEELLARSIKSNVEMAEALSTIAKQMTLGLGAILSNAELLRVFREDQREKRQLAADAVYNEALRLRKIVQEFGQQTAKAVPEAAGGTNPRSLPPAASRTHTMTASKPPGGLKPPEMSHPPTAPTLEGAMREALQSTRAAVEARGFKVELSVPAGLAMPRCPIDPMKKAIQALVLGVSYTAPSGASATLRCERKPVLLRGKSGEEIKREFLMVALAHGPSLSAADQQRVLSGADTGPLGDAWRLVREMGGFVRFAPLQNGVETRLFLPAQ